MMQAGIKGGLTPSGGSGAGGTFSMYRCVLLANSLTKSKAPSVGSPRLSHPLLLSSLPDTLEFPPLHPLPHY